MEKERRVKDLNIHAQFVHMAQAGANVQQLSRCLDSSRTLVITPAPEPDRAVDKPESVGTGIAGSGCSSRVERDWLKTARAVIEVLPGGFRFVYVCIYIYPEHDSSIPVVPTCLRAHNLNIPLC